MTVARWLAEGLALGHAVEVRDPGAWITFDEGVRTDDWYQPAYGAPVREDTAGWSRLTAFLRGADRLSEPQLALALCDRDGRKRKLALRLADGHPALLPLVVLRCADWAAPVREQAREVLTRTLDPASAVRLGPLILRIGDRRRGDFALGLAGEVLSRASAEQFAPLLTDPDRAVRRFAHRQAITEGRLSPAELARTAAQDDDAVVRNLCAEAALAAVTEGGDWDDVVEPLLAARSPQSRAAGVTALRRLGRPERAVGFLADPAGLVRACARYVVRQHGTDPIPWYRDRCAELGDLALRPGAVIGLAECGQRGDAALLRPLLDHPAPGVRARAVAGLRILDVTDVPGMRALLDDPAPGVVREATLALLPSAGSLPEAWLTERLATGRSRAVRVSAYRLLYAQGGAVQRRVAMRTLNDPDERLRQRAEAAVRRWERSPYAVPVDADADADVTR